MGSVGLGRTIDTRPAACRSGFDAKEFQVSLPTCLPSPRALASSRVIPAALIALLFAAVLLPLAPSAGAAGLDTPALKPAAGPIIDVIPEPEPTETPQVSVDGPILVETEPEEEVDVQV